MWSICVHLVGWAQGRFNGGKDVRVDIPSNSPFAPVFCSVSYVPLTSPWFLSSFRSTVSLSLSVSRPVLYVWTYGRIWCYPGVCWCYAEALKAICWAFWEVWRVDSLDLVRPEEQFKLNLWGSYMLYHCLDHSNIMYMTHCFRSMGLFLVHLIWIN